MLEQLWYAFKGNYGTGFLSTVIPYCAECPSILRLNKGTACFDLNSSTLLFLEDLKGKNSS